MSQPAKQTGTVIAAAPVKDAIPLTTVVTRPLPKNGKRPLTGPEAEGAAVADAAVPAQALLLAQVTGEPLNATRGQVAEACPVSEPGVADACGLSGAADAHPAAGGALWALAALPAALLTGLFFSWLPASRAARQDPVSSLRSGQWSGG